MSSMAKMSRCSRSRSAEANWFFNALTGSIMGLTWCSPTADDTESGKIDNIRSSINTEKYSASWFTPTRTDTPSTIKLIRTIDCKFDKKCPQYLAAKNHKCSVELLQHLQTKLHSAEECTAGKICAAYKRCINGGYRLDDLCHLQIYFHPPRLNRGSHQSWKDWKFLKTDEQHGGIVHYKYNAALKTKKGLLDKEVTTNGYASLFSPTAGSYESLYQIVQQKLTHPIHLSYGSPLNYDEMLALVLYTSSGDICKDLRSSEQNEDYVKWKHFRINIANAVYKLPSVNKNTFDGSGMLYYGLSKVCGDDAYNGWWQAASILSASIDRDVATEHIRKEGCVLEFPLMDTFGKTFETADVSWISAFPDEQEVIVLPNREFYAQYLGVEDLSHDKKLHLYRIKTEE